MIAVSVLSQGTLVQKLSLAFQLYDVNGDGVLTYDEILEIVKVIITTHRPTYTHRRRQRGAGRAVAPPWIFIHGIFRPFFPIFSVFLLFFDLFSVAPSPPGRSLIVLFFGIFCYFSVFFSVAPPSPWKIFCRRPCIHLYVVLTAINSFVACLHNQSKSGFLEGRLFSSQSGVFENFSDCSDWLDKISGWCGHGFESHSQPFLLTYPEADLSL